MFTLGIVASAYVSDTGTAIIYGSGSSGTMYTFRWTNASGWGTAYSQPSSMSNTTNYDIEINKSNSIICLGNPSHMYNWSFATGYGTKITNSSSPAAPSAVTQWSNDDAVVFCSQTIAYAWSNSTGWGTKYTDPATVRSGRIRQRPGGTDVAFQNETSPYVHAYAWSNSTGWGTKYANPATLPTAPLDLNTSWHSSGNDIGFVVDASPRMALYAWSSGFGTKYANPASIPPIYGSDVKFGNTSTTLAQVSSGATPFWSAYAWTSGTGFGAKYANPSVIPTNAIGHRAQWGVNDSIVMYSGGFSTGTGATPVYVYAWSSGFGTKYANSASQPADPSNFELYDVLYANK